MAQIINHAPFFDQSDYPILTNDGDQSRSPLGRFGRLSYMAWVMVMILASVATMTLLAIIGAIAGVTFSYQLDSLLVGALCLAPFLYFMVVSQILRLHDLNHSGWWVTLPLINIPVAQILITLTHSVNLGVVLTWICLITNIIFTLYLMIAEGDEGINDYGVPRLTSPWEKITGWIYVGFSVIGLIGFGLVAIPAYQNYQEQTAMMHISMQPYYQFNTASSDQ